MQNIEPAPEVQRLLHVLDDAYDRPAWHGPNLRGSIRRVNVQEASWRPAPTQRNIWEIVVHAAYWKYVIWRKLADAKRGTFPRKGSNWFLLPAPETPNTMLAKTWRDDVALLDDIHGKLRAAIAELTPDALPQPLFGSATHADLIAGITLHDVYHAGQIQLLKQLYKTTAAARSVEERRSL